MKSAQRQMVKIRTPESLYFDEVFFVLKQNVEEESLLLREARRILQSSDGMEKEARKICADTRVLRKIREKRKGALGAAVRYLLAALVGGVMVVAIIVLLL